MKTSSPTEPILLGSVTGDVEPDLKVFYEGSELHPHQGKPWMLRWLKDRDGKTLTTVKLPTGNVTIAPESLRAHALHVGASDSGKTRLALHLFREQLKRGCSGVLMDGKPATIQRAIQCAVDAGMKKEQITVIWPQNPRYGVPGWNPLAVPLDDVEEAVGQWATSIKSCFDAWGNRMHLLMKNAGVVMAGQNLSLWELCQFIEPTNEAYRTAVLKQAKQTEAWEKNLIRHQYFETTFKGVAKTESVGSVISRLTDSVANPYLTAMFCSRTDQLQLETLWKEPRVVIIHLDEAALTEDGARLLAAMIVRALYAICMKKPGDVPVVMVMDELDNKEKYLGEALTNIMARAREQGIRMIGACQNFDQMPPALRKLFKQAALQAYFNLEWEDATPIASYITAGTPGRDVRVSVTAHKEDTVSIATFLTDVHGSNVRFTDAGWNLFTEDGNGSLESLKILGRASNIFKLFALSPLDDKTLIPLDDYVKGLPVSSYAFHNPAKVWVTVTFPRPLYKTEEKESAKENQDRTAHLLANLGQGECVIKMRGNPASHIKVTPVEFDAMPDPLDFLGNGQTAGEIVATAKRRKAAIEALSGRRMTTDDSEYQEVSDDGNL